VVVGVIPAHKTVPPRTHTRISNKRSLDTLIDESVDSVLRIQRRRGDLRLTLEKEGRFMLYRPVPYYQTTLDEYMG